MEITLVVARPPKGDGPPVAAAVFEAGGQEAGELVRDERKSILPAGASRGAEA